MGSLTPAKQTATPGFVATRADALINWGRKNSLWQIGRAHV